MKEKLSRVCLNHYVFGILLVIAIFVTVSCGKSKKNEPDAETPKSDSSASVDEVDPVSKKVIDKINSIGEVSIESEQLIDEIYELYGTLTDDQKKQVVNYADLIDAKDKINKLKEEEKNNVGENILISRNYYETINEAIKSVTSNLKSKSSFKMYKMAVNSSILWKSSSNNNDDSYYTVCFTFSAENSFGAQVDDTVLVVFRNGKIDAIHNNDSLYKPNFASYEDVLNGKNDIWDETEVKGIWKCKTDGSYRMGIDLEDYAAQGYSLNP